MTTDENLTQATSQKAPAPKRSKKKAAPGKTEKAAPLTQEDFEAEFQQLATRARASGVNTARSMLRLIAQQGMKTVESLLASVDTPAKAPKIRKR